MREETTIIYRNKRYMVGTIEEAVAKAEQLAEAA